MADTETNVDALAGEFKQLRAEFTRIASLLEQTARSAGAEAAQRARAAGDRVWAETQSGADQVAERIKEQPLASAAAKHRMGQAFSRLLMRLAVGAGAAMIAIAGGMVAITFVIIAIYELLETLMQPWLAALSTAGLAVLVAALVIIIARIIMKVALPKHPKAAKPPLNMSELGVLLGKEARGFVESNSWSTLALVAVLGFLFAFSPRLRSIIWKLL